MFPDESLVYEVFIICCRLSPMAVSPALPNETAIVAPNALTQASTSKAQAAAAPAAADADPSAAEAEPLALLAYWFALNAAPDASI